MDNYCVLLETVTYDADTEVLKLIIVQKVGNKGMQCGLTVFPMKTLYSILDYERVIFGIIQNHEGIFRLKGFFEASQVQYCDWCFAMYM